MSMRMHYKGQVTTEVFPTLLVWEFGKNVREEFVCEVRNVIFEVFVDFFITWGLFLDKRQEERFEEF